MAILYAPSRYVPVDGSGHVYPGAKLYFYQTGTVTLQDTYSDADLAVGHKNTNPVVADSNGLFGPIYLGNNTVEYKAILKTSADVTVWTTDPLSSTVSQGGLTPYAADTGTATAYAIAPTPAVTSVSVGQGYRFLAGNTNTTTTPTLTVGSASAGVITWPNGAALAAGDIKINSMVEVIVATATPTFHLQTTMGRWRTFGTVTPSAVATVDFTGIPSTVADLQITFSLQPATNAAQLAMQFYNSVGVIDTAANYAYANGFVSTAGTASAAGSGGVTALLTSGTCNSTRFISGTITLCDIQRVAPTNATWANTYFDSGGTLIVNTAGGGQRTTSGPITGIRLVFSSGNVTAGRALMRVSD